MAKNQLLAHLQNRSVVAIESVLRDRRESDLEPSPCEISRDNFDNILGLAREAFWLSYRAYDVPSGLKPGDSLIQEFKVEYGPGGLFAISKSMDLQQGYSVPADAPHPEGWAKNYNKPVVIISFRGTEFLSVADWITNIRQGFGGTTRQYDFALRYSDEVLAGIPDDHLVVFTGHSLGGSLATYTALYQLYKKGRKAIAVTFNSAGLHPANMQRVVNNMNELKTTDITNVYHFLAHSADGRTDVVGNLSFAGYSILPGAKYFIQRKDIVLGTEPSLLKYKALHAVKPFGPRLLEIEENGASQAMSCEELHGREIFIHLKPGP